MTKEEQNLIDKVEMAVDWNLKISDEEYAQYEDLIAKQKQEDKAETTNKPKRKKVCRTA